MLKAQGTGPIMFSSYGAIHKVDIPDGQTYIVDTGHVVGFSQEIGDNNRFSVKTVKKGGVAGLLFSGEGLVAEYTGPGTVWIQTRNLASFAGVLATLMPSSNNSSGGGLVGGIMKNL